MTAGAAVDLVLSRLDGVTPRAGYWMARCPAHDDARASLSVRAGDDQPVVFHCHAGCHRDDILAALSLTLADVSAPRETPPGGLGAYRGDPIVTVYDYTDEHGQVLFQVCRTATKQFPQRRPDGTGGWAWNLRGTRRVPYRLPAVIAAAAAGRVIYVTEGEKDVHAIEKAGGTATTNPGGAGKWRPDYAAWFRGATVVVVADKDEPGRKHAAAVAAALDGVAASVTVAEAAAGKDAADHLAAGHSLAEFASGGTGRALPVIDLEPASEFVLDPVLICRDMLYRGGVHTLSGPPDSGKTTLAFWWMLQAIRDGLAVLFLDEEGGREIVTEKFQALGIKPGERIGYVQFPSRAWDAGDIAALDAALAARSPALVAWDSSAAFLARAGLDENAAADVTRFYAQVLAPAARGHDAAVLVIDHDTKNAEPSRYARGSGAKLAATDVAYKIIPVRAFSKTDSGMSKLLVTKDRRGWLARAHEAAFLIDANGAAPLTVSITESGPGAGDPDLAPAESKTLAVLDSIPCSKRDLIDRILATFGHRHDPGTVDKSLTRLEKLGLAERGPKVGAAQLWKKTP